MRIRHLLTGLLLSALLAAASIDRSRAQIGQPRDDDPVAAASARVTTFFESLGGKGAALEKALAELLLDGPLAARKAAVESLLAETRKLEGRYGKYRVAERITAKRVGDDVVVLTYLTKCDNFPVVWHFTFYRDQRPTATPAAWHVIAVRFDTDVELLAM
jgi:hypothetical protein